MLFVNYLLMSGIFVFNNERVIGDWPAILKYVPRYLCGSAVIVRAPT